MSYFLLPSMPTSYILLGVFNMDKIIYTGKAAKEAVIRELDEILSRFIDELKEELIKKGADKG